MLLLLIRVEVEMIEMMKISDILISTLNPPLRVVTSPPQHDFIYRHKLPNIKFIHQITHHSQINMNFPKRKENNQLKKLLHYYTSKPSQITHPLQVTIFSTPLNIYRYGTMPN